MTSAISIKTHYNISPVIQTPSTVPSFFTVPLQVVYLTYDVISPMTSYIRIFHVTSASQCSKVGQGRLPDMHLSAEGHVGVGRRSPAVICRVLCSAFYCNFSCVFSLTSCAVGTVC